ncbi:MAG: hypothetical protein P4L59_07255 [Desulfosporosinus sp.]|nr:hypothetical protein [Desulfosporosinus sp.]
MTLSQAFFIPLYFDETEADLWLALQEIEPEKRTAFIKASLRQVLLQENETEIPLGTADFLQEESAEVETFSLEALFSKEVKPTPPQKPWDHLLQTMLGIEEDIVVEEQNIQLDSVENQEFKLELLQVETSLPSTGFEYMMKHIIGIEDDEAVLKILRGEVITGY